MKRNSPPGATPLDPDELKHLIPPDVSTQEQLNMVEQENIARAELWVFARKRRDVLTEPFLRKLHQKMFQTVWRWAGQYRKTEKNLGVVSYLIREEVQKLLADARYWIEKQVYPWDELGVRFHHRLVCIHPFSNGNGRHARLLTDVLLVQYDQPRPTWGTQVEGDLQKTSERRLKYLQALRQADQHSFEELFRFMKS